MKTQAIYLPTAEEIAAATRKIRSGWTSRERRVRERTAKRRQASLSRTLTSSLSQLAQSAA